LIWFQTWFSLITRTRFIRPRLLAHSSGYIHVAPLSRVPFPSGTWQKTPKRITETAKKLEDVPLMPAVHGVVMGVSGSGKSTVGKLLAREISATFVDGDDLHPEANVAKMAGGKALDDADREPWLEAIGREFARAGEKSLVVACSALKKSYREILRCADPSVRFVFLEGPYELLSQRLGSRSGHFMPPSLLQSQLAILEPIEPDECGFALNVARKPEELAKEAARRLKAA
jgi:carbohydrate kinase (thermoresistant glucokinase family)